MNKGYICECGTSHTFSMYVHAHWDEELIHSCHECDRKYTVIQGYVRKKAHRIKDRKLMPSWKEIEKS